MIRQNILVGSFLVAVIVGVSGVILFPIYAGDREVQPRTSCLVNLRQLGVCVQIYTGDWDDRYPAVGWHDELLVYTKSSDRFSCPQLVREEKQYGYAFHAPLLGVKTSEIPINDQSKFPMLFETNALAKGVIANLAAQSRARHGNGSNVAFCDTSAKFVSFSTEKE